MKLLVRILAGTGVLVIVVAFAGWTWQNAMESRDERELPPPGRLVDVGGHRMHIYCQGQGHPTVIVEQGIGAQSLAWAPLNEQMSSITTLCAYDRVGMGYSEPVDHPTSAREVATNLNELLKAAGMSDDIVLVGWSAGGMYAREYYRQFPEHVKGMVLVDSAHEQQLFRMPPPPDESFNPMKVYRYLAPLGWVRATGRIERQFAKAPLPASLRERLIAINLKSHMYRTLLAEGAGFEADLAENRAPPSLGDLPLIVLTEGKPNIPFMRDNLAVWNALHAELAKLSTNSKHIIATNSAHAIHRSEPQLIFESVREVVAAVRSGEPLH
jgi:pimeloyl-ACP methyl ester carboxylesterase